MENKQIENEEEIAHRIVGMWLKYQFTVWGANITVLYILNLFGYFNRNTFIFMFMLTFFLCFNGRRILRTYLNKREKKVLRQISGLL
jgi:hypothetical protein